MMFLFQRVSDSLHALGIAAAAYAAISLLCLLGGGFLLAAGTMALARALGAIAASAIIGVLFLGLAGIVYAVIASAARRRKEQRRKTAANAAMVASSLSLANTGARLLGRLPARSLVIPAAAVGLAAWFFTRERD